MGDRTFGAIGLALAALFVWRATLIEDSFIVDAVGPRAFPYIIAAIMALASLYFLIRPDPRPVWPSAGRMAEIFFAVVVMVLYAELLPELGFLIATALASAYLTWRLGTTPVMSVIVGIATSGGIYVVFRIILGLSLARGPFGF